VDGVRNDKNSCLRVTIQDKTWVTVTTQNLNSSPLCVKASEESRRSQDRHQEYTDIFFECQGIVHQEFAPPGQMASQRYYWEVLQSLRNPVNQTLLRDCSNFCLLKI